MNLELDYDVAVVTGTTDDNWYGVQAKGFGGSKAGLGFSNFQPPFGFASRPLDATIESDGTPVGCTFFKASFGRAGDLAWLGHDPRLTDKCPPLTKGSSAQWNAKGQFALQDSDSDTHTIYVPVAFASDGTPSKAHLVQIGFESNGKRAIDIRHSDGMAIVMMENSVTIKNAAGNAYIEVNADGIVLNGNTKLVGGTDVGGGTAIPVALATPLVSYLSALETALSALATAVDGKTPSSPGVSSGAISAFVGSAASFKAALVSMLTKAI